jgi:hypothetical protein
LLEDFTAKLGREDFLTYISEREFTSSSNCIAVMIVKFPASRKLNVSRTMFPYHNIRKFTWRYNGKTQSNPPHFEIPQITCDNMSSTGAYLVVAEVMERLSASKRATQNFDIERFDLRKLNVSEGAELYQIKF